MPVVGKLLIDKAAERIIVPIPVFVKLSTPTSTKKVGKEISRNPFC
jgi:hypothetical protein